MIRGSRVLCIEDDAAVAGLLVATLEAEGCRMDVRGNCRDGIAAFDESIHDLVIVDFQLPDGNGLDVLEALKARGAATPVIIATGAGSEEVAVRAMKLGAADYILKEGTQRFLGLLAPTIERVLRQHALEQEKQRAEIHLRESEERLRSVLSSMDDAVFVTDAAGRLVALRAREGAEEGRGDARGWIGKRLVDVYPADVAAQFDAAFAAVQSSGAPVSFDYRLPGEAGDVWLNAKVSSLKDAAGRFAGVTIVARDISDRKAAEERLHLATRAADAANQAKSELLAGMSHELRTPLTAIIGYTEVLLNEYFGPVNERQRHHLDIVLQSSHHLLDLINDILDIAKIESGKAELDLSPVRLAHLVGHAVALFRETAMRRKVQLRATVPPELEALVLRVDERRLKQVLFNLLSNALKFTPPEGTVDLLMAREAGCLVVRVVDTGIGIPPKELERIFDAFYQVRRRAPAGERPQGSGLGLSLAREIIGMHGGRIWAESEGDGRGSTLAFTLPLVDEAPAE